MIEGGTGDYPSCLHELIGLSLDRERALLGQLYSGGWGQGCLILDSADLRAPRLAPDMIEWLLREVGDRASIHPAGEVVDPYEHEEMPQLLPDQDRGLLVLSQRCDIVKPLCSEPLVEVAIARRLTDAELLAAARRGGSACCLHLADDGEDPDAGWLVDVRTRGHLPKHWLKDRTPAQLIAPGRSRRRFANRLGERSSRIPVPAEIVDGFQSMLRDWLYSSATRREWCSHFSDLLLLPAEDGGRALIAILGEGKDADAAMEDFDALLAAIIERVYPFPISSDYSGVLRPEELSHADYLAAYKLDFKRVTYGSRADGSAQAEPALEQAERPRYTF